MAKQKTNIFITLVLVLLIIAAVTAWITHDKAQESDPDNTAAPENSSEVIVTTAEPLETSSPAAPTAVPETAAPQPTATPAPTPQGDGRVNQSGSFRSDTGTKLNTIIEWKAVSIDEHNLSVTVNVYVQSYSLEIGSRAGSTIYVNGNGYSFRSSPITHTDNNNLQKTQITTVTVTVPAEAGSTVNIPISVDWYYHGQYSGEDIEHIIAESIATVNA
ncbi:MAG: hypothetical protein Q4A83_04615 [Bacillota bacterium]|nr:hypothetical protein [Bacillota bacterium]